MTPASTARLVTIPVAEIAPGGQVRHAIDDRARARALRDDCLAWLPGAVRLLLPAMDAVTRHWLKRSASPYVAEIAAIAEARGFRRVDLSVLHWNPARAFYERIGLVEMSEWRPYRLKGEALAALAAEARAKGVRPS